MSILAWQLNIEGLGTLILSVSEDVAPAPTWGMLVKAYEEEEEKESLVVRSHWGGLPRSNGSV